jgi:hypothetical protein
VANYIARVELLDAENDEDFEKLDNALEQRGFLSQIQDDNHAVFWLPTGAYVIQNTDMTLTAARDSAIAAAEETGFEFSLIVAEFENAEWSGLQPIETAS